MIFPRERHGVARAFTLVELLVVVAVIGILSALILSAVVASKQNAQSTLCRNNQHQRGIALTGFVSDHHVYPLYITKDRESEHRGTWIHALQHEMGKKKPEWTNILTGVWQCPSAVFRDFSSNGIPSSYAYNVYGLFSAGNAKSLGLGGDRILRGSFIMPVNESEVLRPSEMMAIGESFSGGVVFMRQQLLASSSRAASRHGGKANVLFGDGHVESPTLAWLYSDRSDAALVRWSRDHQPHREQLQ